MISICSLTKICLGRRSPWQSLIHPFFNLD